MLIDHFIETAVDIDVIDPDNPKKLFLELKECSQDCNLMRWKQVLCEVFSLELRKN